MSRPTVRIEDDMAVLTFTLPREQIVFFRFVLESYDGLGTQTSVSGSNVVQWRVPVDQLPEAERLIDALLQELSSS